MKIAHNLLAMDADNFLGISIKKRGEITEKLSSGYRINRAGDDAAGLAISEKMRSEIRSLNQASRNGQDGISLIQTADGALNEVHGMLQRMNKISVQAANGTYSEEDRSLIQKELGQLVKEVDSISDKTEFNGMKLLDGTLKDESASPAVLSSSLVQTNTNSGTSLQEILNSKSSDLNIIYIEDTSDYSTTTTQVGSTTASGYSSLKNILQTEIVPQAVTNIISAYSPAFDYLSSSSVGIGLKLYSDSSTTLASVGVGYSYYTGGSVVDNMLTYTLSVNLNSLNFTDASGNLTTGSRTALETTIVHEMVHALMDEALTNGMIGVSAGNLDASESFPKWFKEGMAQSAAGGYSNSNDWVNSGLGIDTSTSTSDISTIVKSGANCLANDDTSNASSYGTGYLATMYLGYLANGSSSISATSIGDGLGIILNKLNSGSSLDSVINEVSGSQYTSASDFESKFGDANSSNFIYNLTIAAGAAGNGGLASGNLNDSDLLSDTSISTSLFSLDTTNDTVKNIYPSGVTVFEGGTTTKSVSGSTTPSNPGSGVTSPALGGVIIQIGSKSNESMTIFIDSSKASDLGIDGLSVLTQDDAEKAMGVCNKAIETVSKIRSNLGAYQNRLEHTTSSLDNTEENLQNAESRIRDIDMAKGIMEYSKYEILIQTGQAMLAQANQNPKNVLALLA